MQSKTHNRVRCFCLFFLERFFSIANLKMTKYLKIHCSSFGKTLTRAFFVSTVIFKGLWIFFFFFSPHLEKTVFIHPSQESHAQQEATCCLATIPLSPLLAATVLPSPQHRAIKYLLFGSHRVWAQLHLSRPRVRVCDCGTRELSIKNLRTSRLKDAKKK